MAQKKVTFKTRAATYIGRVIEKYSTSKGEFARVKCDDGNIRSVRPSQLQPA